MTSKRSAVELVVIGGSAGGLEALDPILRALPDTVPFAIAVVLHVPPVGKGMLPTILRFKCKLPVHSVEDKEPLLPAHVYVAPPNYHVLVERTHVLSLSVDEPVNFSRPSIDVLFESAADALGSRILGVLLSGANDDGAKGLERIAHLGGTTIVQAPETAAIATMPEAALKRTPGSLVLTPSAIGEYLAALRSR